ncbi:MAG: TonB family protein, partial [Pedobacter sp.]
GNPESAGRFVNFDKPDGIWKFYHSNGEVSAKEVYRNGALMDKTYFNEQGEVITDTSATVAHPKFPGGAKAWQKHLLKQIYFPRQFQFTNGDRAVVVVSFTINVEGKVEDVEVTTPFYPEFDKIAKDAVLKSPKWQPAINHNRRVKSHVRQPVTFEQTE